MCDLQEIATLLNAKKAGADTWYGDCPACGYKGSLAITERDDTALFYCHACCDSRTVFAAVRGLGLVKQARPALPPMKLQLMRRGRDHAKRSEAAYARKLWDDAAPLVGSPVETYLRGRGITVTLPNSLRYLPNARHGPSGRWFPCLLAAVTVWPGHEVVAVHRTFLSHDGQGKADVTPAKMSLGPVRGGAVRLSPVHGDTLAICEGLETGLSLMQLFDLPVWACLSTGGMQTIMLPDVLKRVIIAADHDEPGLAAADAAKDRLQRLGVGCEVEVITPPLTGSESCKG